MIWGEELKGSGVRTCQITAAGFISFVRKFRIFTDDPTIGQYAIFSWLQDPSESDGYPEADDVYTPVPIGQPYATNSESCPYSYLASIQLAEEAEDGCQWIATCNYEPWDPSIIGQINPLDAFAQASFTFQTRQVPVYYVNRYNDDGSVVTDVNNNPVLVPTVNSAGQWFPTGINKDLSEPVLQITRNEQNINTTFISSIINCTNLYGAGSPNVQANNWLSNYPPKTLRFNNYELQWMYHPIIGVYFQVQYKFAVNWNTWIDQVMDQGTCSIDPTRGYVTQNYRTYDGSIVTDPQRLDGNGYLQQPINQGIDRLGSLLANPSITMPAPVWLAFEKYAPIDFSVFNFNFPPAQTIILPPWWTGAR